MQQLPALEAQPVALPLAVLPEVEPVEALPEVEPVAVPAVLPAEALAMEVPAVEHTAALQDSALRMKGRNLHS